MTPEFANRRRRWRAGDRANPAAVGAHPRGARLDRRARGRADEPPPPDPPPDPPDPAPSAKRGSEGPTAVDARPRAPAIVRHATGVIRVRCASAA
jgi:hypothetical protein